MAELSAGGQLTELEEKVLKLFPVGAEMPWENGTPPDGWFIQDGGIIDPVLYPKLTAHLGRSTLPDCRSAALRGLDNGRGIDVGRVLGSEQLDQDNSITRVTTTNRSNTGTTDLTSIPQDGSLSGYFRAAEARDGSSNAHLRFARFGHEVRMRNVAKNWIIRHD